FGDWNRTHDETRSGGSSLLVARWCSRLPPLVIARREQEGIGLCTLAMPELESGASSPDAALLPFRARALSDVKRLLGSPGTQKRFTPTPRFRGYVASYCVYSLFSVPRGADRNRPLWREANRLRRMQSMGQTGRQAAGHGTDGVGYWRAAKKL